MHYCACDTVFWARTRALNRSLRSLSLRRSGTLPIGRLPEPLRSRRPRRANDYVRWLGTPRHHCAVSPVAGSRFGGPCRSHRSRAGPACAHLPQGEARYGFRCTESSCPGLAGGRGEPLRGRSRQRGRPRFACRKSECRGRARQRSYWRSSALAISHASFMASPTPLSVKRVTAPVARLRAYPRRAPFTFRSPPSALE